MENRQGSMVRIGKFFFKYRNVAFIGLYLALLIPSPVLFSKDRLGADYFWYPIILGGAITVLGQMIRGLAIALAYIVRGGKNKEVYAEELVVEGMFAHCRNPLYVGNILMLTGMAVLSNSWIYLLVFIPLFFGIYQSIILAEENFLRNKFGEEYERYCGKVSRWRMKTKHLGRTIGGMHFEGKRWLLKEYNTQAIWLFGISYLILFRYPELTGSPLVRNQVFGLCLLLIAVFYFTIRRWKKKEKRGLRVYG